MKYTWEESDIESGAYFVKFAPKDNQYAASTLHKIGWINIFGMTVNGVNIDSKPDDNRYVSIAISDGMVMYIGTKDDFVEYLNKGEYIPISYNRLLEIIPDRTNYNR